MLNGKTAVITGGTRGIGRAIAEEFASNGADLAIIATRESDAAKDAVKSLEAGGVKVRFYACNIRNSDDVILTTEQILVTDVSDALTIGSVFSPAVSKCAEEPPASRTVQGASPA